VQKKFRLTVLRWVAIAQVAMALFIFGCKGHDVHTKGVYVLVDASTANADWLRRARLAINTLLGNLGAEDTLAVARVDSPVLGKKHVPTVVQFAQRPSVMTAQKRMFQKQISTIAPSPTDDRQVDLTAGLLQAAQFLNQLQSTQKIVLIASSLNHVGHEEDQKAMFFRLDGITIFAPDLTRQAASLLEANEYRQQLDRLQALIESSGGSLRVINDLARFDLAD
jgi:hypothetical protein